MGSIRYARNLVSYRSPCTETWINKALVLKGSEGIRVDLESVRLSHGLLLPFEPHPLKVLLDQVIISGSNPGPINVLKPEEKDSIAMVRRFPGHESGISVAEVHWPGRTGGEAGSHGKSLRV